MTTAAIYTRLSLADRLPDGTLDTKAVERQEKAARALLAAKYPDATVRVYVDNSVSATSGKRRPEWERLLEDVAAGVVTVVGCLHLDRLNRSMEDLSRITRVGQPLGLAIECVQGVSLNMSDATGVAVAQIITVISGMETSRKSERQKAANAQARDAGHGYWRTRPYGNNLDGSLHPVEAPLIQQAAQDLLEGWTLAAVVRRWTEAGHRTQFGKAWTPSSLRQLLLNPRLAGIRAVTIRGKANTFQEVGAGSWEAVLQEDVWRNLDALLRDSGRRTAKGNRTTYMLSTYARCGVCGAHMVSASHNGQRGYRCSQSKHRSVKAEYAEAATLFVLSAALSQPDAQERYGSATGGPDPERIAELRREIAEWQREADAGNVSGSEYVRFTKPLRVELDALLAEAAAATLTDDLAGLWRAQPDEFRTLPLERIQRVLSRVLPVIRVDAPPRRGTGVLARMHFEEAGGDVIEVDGVRPYGSDSIQYETV